jgi:hypothetical protein
MSIGSSKWRLEVDDFKKGDLVVIRSVFAPKRALIIGETQAPDVVSVLWLETGMTGPVKKHWLRKLEDRGE